MARGLLILSALAICGGNVQAQELDKAKLRAAVYWPRTILSVSLVDPDRDERGKKVNMKERVERALAKLTGGPEDAAAHYDAALIYFDQKETEAGEAELDKAEALLQPHLEELSSQKKGRLLSVYAGCLSWRSLERAAEAEKWARRAAEISPTEPECHTCLGWCILGSILKDMDNGLAKRLQQVGWCRALSEEADLTTQVSANQADALCLRLDEAVACFVEASRLAADDPKFWERYCDFCAWEWSMRKAVLQRKTAGATSFDLQAARRLICVLDKAAALNPENLTLQAGACMTTLTAFMDAPASVLLKHGEAIAKEMQEAASKYRGRIRRGTWDKDREVAAYAHVLLAATAPSWDSEGEAFADGRRAFHLNPDLPLACALCESVLRKEARWEEALVVAKVRFEQHPSIKNRYLLADAFAKAAKPGTAESMLRECIEFDKSDPFWQLALAAHLVATGRPGGLEEAGTLLEKLRPALSKRDENYRVDFACTDLIRRALAGESPDKIRGELQKLALDKLEPDRLQPIVEAFGLNVAKVKLDSSQLHESVKPTQTYPYRRFFEGAERRIWASQDPPNAIARLEDKLRNSPDDAPVLFEMHRVHMRRGETQKGIEAMKGALELFPELREREPDNAYWATLHAYALLLYRKETEQADKVLAKDNSEEKDWRLAVQLGELALARATLVAKEMSDNAKQTSSQAPRVLAGVSAGIDCVKRDLAKDDARRKSSIVQRLQSLFDLAEEQFDHAAAIAHNEPVVWRARLRMHWWEYAMFLSYRRLLDEETYSKLEGRRALAILRDFQKLAQLFPMDPDFLFETFLFLQASSGNHPEFLPECQKIPSKLESFANDKDKSLAVRAIQGAAHCWWRLGEFDRALVCARKGMELAPDDPPCWSIAAECLGRKQQLGEAAELLERQLEKAPDSTCHAFLGAFEFALFRYPTAERHFQAGLKLSPTDLNCTLGLAAVHLIQSDKPDHLAEAEKWLQKAETMLAGQPNADYSRLYGIFRALQGDAAIAQIHLRQALDLDPNNAATKAALDAVRP